MLQMMKIHNILLWEKLLQQQKFCLGFGVFFVYTIYIVVGQTQNMFFRKMLWKNLNNLFGPSNNILCMCAKLLQSCLTLGNPMDCSLPGSSIQGIL